jgi:hypothetical protein
VQTDTVDVQTRTPTDTATAVQTDTVVLPTRTPTATSTPTATDSLTLTLRINHEMGRPGSYFTFRGGGFPPNTRAQVRVNGELVNDALPIDATGAFTFTLNTAGAVPGLYTVSVSVDTDLQAIIERTASFELRDDAPEQPRETGEEVPLLTVAPVPANNATLYLPLLVR